MVRVGDVLYFIYRTKPVTGGDSEARVYIRGFDLTSDPPAAIGPAALVSDVVSQDTGQVHDEPALFRDYRGALHALWRNPAEENTHSGTCAFSPRHRLVPDPAAPTSEPATRIFARFEDTDQRFTSAPLLFDAMGVFDERTGVSHFVADGARFAPDFDGVTSAGRGIGRGYYRICPGGSLDGPWLLVEAACCLFPPDAPSTKGGGNIFTKGNIVLGNEDSGQRSLHLVWNIRHSYLTDRDNPDTERTFNYDLRYARSDDGGDTWHNLGSTTSRGLLEHMRWDDTAYQVVAADLLQGSERAWDVDNDSFPNLLYARYKTGTGVEYDGHVDNRQAAQYELVFSRWDSSAWTQPSVVADSVNGPGLVLTKVRVDEANNIYLFDGSGFGSGLPKYNLSTDRGASWLGWTSFGDKTGSWRPYSYADPIDPNYHYVALQVGLSTSPDFGRVFLYRLRLTPDVDGDTVADSRDNCPALANRNQLDSDGDGSGDACDPCLNNGVCEPGESCTADCLEDCIAGVYHCGNGYCSAGEDCVTCPADCNGRQSGKKSTWYCCGDPNGPGQSHVPCSDTRCAADGKVCTSADVGTFYCCGDADCEGPETAGNCLADCGTAPCGNGVCGATESACSCPQDCGAPAAAETSCSDLIDDDCDGFVDVDDEECLLAPCTCSTQPNGCVGFEGSYDANCVRQPVCRDTLCEGSETPCSCPDDCGAPPTAESLQQCSDGLDNDCDGLADGLDSDCCQPTAPNEKGNLCRDGIDNDCDGLTDAQDQGCAR